MRIITLGIFVWIAVELSGQQQPNTQNSTVEGIVVEAASGRPIPDAQVSTDRPALANTSLLTITAGSID